MRREEILGEFQRWAAGSDAAVIEGNKGLYDGLALDGSNSNAALAGLLGAPVILVVDCRGMTRGIAPLLLGYQGFEPRVHIAGVILNRLGGARHESKLREVVEYYTDIPVVGGLQNDPKIEILERHLGLIPSNEAQQAAEKIAELKAVVSDQIDLDLVLRIASTAPAVVSQSPPAEVLPTRTLRIGIAKDRAFGFYYPDDLEAMESEGAKLVPFDTLRDPRLPSVDALFIGGGFPEAVMDELESNVALRREIRAFIESGGPAYAECGGLMYLARTLTWKDRTCEMVGVIPGDVVMHDRPQGRGYARLRETGESGWPAVGAGEISAHEFHYSALENLPASLTYAYVVLRGTGVDGKHDGLLYKNLLASYVHLRGTGGNRWPERFLRHVWACKSAAASTIA